MCGPDTPLVDGAAVRGVRVARRRSRWSRSCPTCSTGRRRRRERPDDRAVRDRRTTTTAGSSLGATGPARATFNAAGRARGRRRPRRHAGSAQLAGEDDERGAARRRARRPRGPQRLGLRRPRDRSRDARRPDAAAGPSAGRLAGARSRASPLVPAASVAALRARPALPRPLLARGGAGAATTCWRAAARSRRRRSTRPRWPRALARVFPGAATTSSARPPRAAAAPVDHRAHRRPRHRQDHHRRADCWRCSPSRRQPRRRRCGSRWPPRPARPPPGCRRRSQARARGARPREDRRPARPTLDGVDPAPAARLAARQQHPLPARPRQPAAARRGRGRRDVDGLADDDGPAARGGPAATPGWCWSATPTSSPRSRPVRCSPTWSPGYEGAPDSPVAALRTTHRFGDARSARSPRRCGSATPTRCSRVLRGRVGRGRAGRHRATTPRRRLRDRAAAARAVERARGRRGRGRRRPRSRRSTGTGCCARTARGPTAYGTGTARSSAGSAERDRRTRSTSRVVRRPPAAGHRQRLRARRLQRRHRRRRPPTADGRLRAVIAGSAGACSTSRPAGSATSRRCTR